MPIETHVRCRACDSHCHAGNGEPCCAAVYPHVEPPTPCAREEALVWLVEHGLDPAEIDWLLGWANRRNANVLERLVEALRGIQSKAVAWKEEPLTLETVTALDDIREMGQTAADALRRAMIGD